MDLQTGLVCVGFVVLSGAVLLIISMLNIKEKTFEEAMAEQRKLPDHEMLIKRHEKKGKPKDKKIQRSGKKVKEKKKAPVRRLSSSTDTDEQPASEPEQVHVKIVSEPEVMGESPKAETQKKKGKNKPKPILVHREPEVVQASANDKPPVVTNHFAEIQPKDDLSLRRVSRSELPQLNAKPGDQPSLSSTEANEEKPVVAAAVKPAGATEKSKKSKNDNSKQAAPPKVVVPKVEVVEVAPVEEVVAVKSEVAAGGEGAAAPPAPVPAPPSQPNKAAKDKKKPKKPDAVASLLQNAVTCEQLSALVRKAELSPSERQYLTNQLLHDPQDDRVQHMEWSEDQQVAKLKKQLAEKEEALANETASAAAFMNKLKELRAELNDERSKSRHLEESMMAKIAEMKAGQTLQARSMQQLQQLQAKMKDETLAKATLQQEVHNLHQQIQQREHHIARISESEIALQGQLHVASQSCNAEAQKNRRLEEELHEALSKLEAFKETSSNRQELLHQIEELRMSRKELEKALDESRKLQKEAEFESKRLVAESHELSAKLLEAGKETQYERSRLQAEIHSLTNRLSELQGHAADRDQLAAEVTRLQEEARASASERDRLKSEMVALSSQRTAADGQENGTATPRNLNTDFINYENESKKKDMVVEKLEKELLEKNQTVSSLKTDLNAQLSRVKIEEQNRTAERLKAQQDEFDKKLTTERETGEKRVQKLQDELNRCLSRESELKSQVDDLRSRKVDGEGVKKTLEEQAARLQQLEGDLKKQVEENRTQVHKYEEARKEVAALQEEIQAQKDKNNDLRQKNWKAVNALSTTEKTFEARLKETDQILKKEVEAACVKTREAYTALLRRLFPNINVLNKDPKDWLEAFEREATSALTALSTTSQPQEATEELEKQVAQLQGVVQHYKTIIEDTEGMLNKLQTHIEAEELRWGQLLEARQAELETLQTQVQEKEKQLEKLQTDGSGLQKLAEEASEKLAQLTKEKEVAETKLASEQERLKELNKEVVKLRSNVKIGQDSYEAEHKIRLELEQQLKVLSCRENVSSGDVANNEAVPVEQLTKQQPETESAKSKKKNKKKNDKIERGRKASWATAEWWRRKMRLKRRREA